MGASPGEASWSPWEPVLGKGRNASFPPAEGLVWHKNGCLKIGGRGTKIVGMGDAWLLGSPRGYRGDCWGQGPRSL